MSKEKACLTLLAWCSWLARRSGPASNGSGAQSRTASLIGNLGKEVGGHEAALASQLGQVEPVVVHVPIDVDHITRSKWQLDL